ncbi:serine aminopeptidase domain-containing protein [Haliangium sp.]|uniref:serine aminopeptidase domain-containing protein n=1 Tax=Haliangium sp. TaxID=2663208 RepID=UPI003D0C1040
MNPLYFGSSDKALFGVYHAPASQPAKNRGVILCNPFGDEAIKSHRAFLQLANRLAAERYHVLRFDYYATGDSAGDSAEGTVEQWLADIDTAADELKDASGVAKVSFVGLRLGASLALTAACKRRDLDRVALWDPVVRGADYVAELRRVHEDYLRNEFGRRVLDPARITPATGDEIMGFPLPPSLREAMAHIDLCALERGKLKRVLLLTSARKPDYAALAAHLTDIGVDLTHENIPVGINWNSDEAMNNASLVPTEAIEAIVAAMG